MKQEDHPKLNLCFSSVQACIHPKFWQNKLWRENVMDNFPSPNLCDFLLNLIKQFGVLGERHRISPSLTSSTAAKMALGVMADLRQKRTKTSVGCQMLLPSHPSKFPEMSGYFGAFISRFKSKHLHVFCVPLSSSQVRNLGECLCGTGYVHSDLWCFKTLVWVFNNQIFVQLIIPITSIVYTHKKHSWCSTIHNTTLVGVWKKSSPSARKKTPRDSSVFAEPSKSWGDFGVFLVTNRYGKYCWWKKSKGQPPIGCIRPCKFWDKLPTSTG